jgi:rubrerythrin
MAGVAGAGTALLAGPLTAAAPSGGSNDVRVLNFALALERLQERFYTLALQRAGLEGELRDFARIALDHERKHVEHLSAALGDRAESAPAFNLETVTADPEQFTTTAIALEDLAVFAYNGQVANVSRPVLKVAAAIVSVEGRHAAWIRDLAGAPPAPRAADLILGAQAVLKRLAHMKLVDSMGGT